MRLAAEKHESRSGDINKSKRCHIILCLAMHWLSTGIVNPNSVDSLSRLSLKSSSSSN